VDALSVRVLDRGPAVPAGERERSGGAGLYEARRLVQLHGGTLDCERRRGGGNVFHLRVPLEPIGEEAHMEVTL
jgi:signal transduction histidine kinase